MRVLFLTRSLEPAGTERQLVELAKGFRRKGHAVSVVEFYPGGALERDLQAAGVAIHSLEEKPGRRNFGTFCRRLLHAVRAERPEFLYAFLGVPCILSVCLKPFFPQVKMVWGVRASYVDLDRYGKKFRYAYRLECRLSRFADLIIANSHAGRQYAIEHGFPRHIRVVPNGIDAERFAPDHRARREIREDWKVDGRDVLIGFVGRSDPMKDPHTFLEAASFAAKECRRLRFVLVGEGLADGGRGLRTAAERHGLGDRVIWAGRRNDMPAVYSSLDVLVSSSCGEGFSNAIAEAMACGVPCAVTDVGDSAQIVGRTGIVVPPRDPPALAEGILALIRSGEFLDGTLQKACRERIAGSFTLDRLVEDTAAAMERLSCTE